MRDQIRMDEGWKFHRGDFTEVRNRWAWGKSGSWNQGPESIAFDDMEWRAVTLPHDFVIEGEPVAYLVNEFDDKDNAIPEMQTVNNMHTTAGSFSKDVGWYRKHFFVPEEDKGKKIYFVFDGIYRDSMLFVNNFFVEHHRSGYTGIQCDITDFVQYGGDNLIAVRADARQPEGWFYEGGGIYRHAYLLKTAKVHIDTVFVSSKADIANETAQITVNTELNVKPAETTTLETKLCTAAGEVIWQTQTPLTGQCTKIEFELKNIQLWDMDTPYMYQMVSKVLQNESCVDTYTTQFGIRDIRFDSEEGFFLNGKKCKLKGVCCHQNHGGLGTALPDEMYTYRIQKLKEMGCNAYRTSHYPPTIELLNACDRLGMLVMDETRLLSSAKEDLEQLTFLVKRDRNHPSIVMYSIGNEEAQSQTTPQGAMIAGTMIETIKQLDDTRPVTMGLLLWDLANRRSIEDIEEIAEISRQLDVAGFNYQEHKWERFHRAYPAQPMVCTEQGTFKSTRGCYQTDKEACHLSVTDKTADSYMKGAAQWRAAKASYMSGLFLWTGFDYYGEPTPFAWPAVSSQFGIMDICGYPKDYYYYYKACWTDEPVLHIFPHWNGTEGEHKDIHVFSNCQEVELFVNGTSLGRKTMQEDDYLEWENTRYVPGELSARGYRAGEVVTETTIRTIGSANQIVLSLDYKEHNLAVIKVSVQDEQGMVVPDADDLIALTIEGDAKLLGSSNGNPSDHRNAHSAIRNAFHGLAQFILQVNGEVKLLAEADGLVSGAIKIDG